MAVGDDPAETLLKFFPKAMLNFDVPPPGTTLGPLHAIFAQVGQTLGQFQADVLLCQAQLSVQQAAGPYLDAHGLFYGLVRIKGEYDDAFRERILLAITHGKLTIAAIQAAVQLYFAPAPYPYTVDVYDLQSDPARAASMGITYCDFVIDITVAFPAGLVFYASRSYAGRNTYVIGTDIPAFYAGRSYAGRNAYVIGVVLLPFFVGQSYVAHNSYALRPPRTAPRSPAHSGPVVTHNPEDNELAGLVIATKSGGYYPIYSFTRSLVANP